MRTSLFAAVVSVLLSNVCAADDRQYFINALTRIRSGIAETDAYIYQFASEKNFPADLALGKTGSMYGDIEMLEAQMESLLIYNGKLTTGLNVLHIRIMNMNSVLADRQRDLQIKLQNADGPFQPLFLELRGLNEVTKASWHARRAVLVSQLLTIEQISGSLVQLRHAAHGFKEQLLAAEPFPEHYEVIKKNATIRLAAGMAEVNAELLQLKNLSKSK